MTAAGLKAIEGPLREHPSKLNNIVIGSGNYKSFEACDNLIEAGVDSTRVHVHLGFAAETKAGRSYHKYRPMMHSKVLSMENCNGTSTAFVGSHNLTDFALTGLNGEMGILIEGSSSHSQFEDIRMHIAQAVQQARIYDPLMKEAYTWWTLQYINGLKQQFNDIPKETNGGETILIIAKQSGKQQPKEGNSVYFEIPAAIGQIRSLRTQVHIFLFDTLPATPRLALEQLQTAEHSFKCKTIGLDNQRGGVELVAEWQVSNSPSGPVLKKTRPPFRPPRSRGMQQVRVEIQSILSDRFEYLFDTHRTTYLPTLDNDKMVRMGEANQKLLAPMKIEPPEHLEWYRVSNLLPSKERTVSEKLYTALLEMSPESGSYILLPLRRRKIETD